MKRRAASCNGKIRHETQREAAAARLAMFTRKHGREKTNIFACAECQGWHIGREGGPINSRPKRGGDRVRVKLARYRELAGT